MTPLSPRPSVRQRKKQKGPWPYVPTVGNPDRTLEKLMDPEVRRQLNAMRHGLALRDQVAQSSPPPSTLPESRKIELPPAHFLVVVARWLLNREAYERYVEPHVLDIRADYFAALKSDRRQLARFVVIRGYWDVLAPFRRGIWVTILRWFLAGL